MAGIRASERGISIIMQALSDEIKIGVDSRYFRADALHYLRRELAALSTGVTICKSRLRGLLEGQPIRLKTLQAICEVLGLPLKEIAEQPPEGDPIRYGGDPTRSPEYFFGRSEELQDLAKYVQSTSCRLITVQGLPGIGKRTLVAKFIKSQKGLNYPPCIWEEFNYGESVDLLLERLIYQLPPAALSSNKISSQQSKKDVLWQRLREKKYLIVLEQNKLGNSQETSNHKPEYAELFRKLAERYLGRDRESCILLITDDRPRDIGTVIPDNLREIIEVQELKLADRVRLLETKFENNSNKVVQDRDVINELAKMSGHPIWLNSTATKIIDYCNENNIQQYLDELRQQLSLPDYINKILNLTLKSLPDSCWIILRLLVNNAEPISQESIQELFFEENTSLLTFLRAFNDIQRPSLLCKYKENNNNEPLYSLVEIVKPLIRNHDRFRLNPDGIK